MKWLALCLLGMSACVPKPALVEAPATLNIPALPKAEASLPEPPRIMPSWAVQRLWNLDTEEIVIDPTQAVYMRGDSKVTITSGRGGVLIAECDKGIKGLLFCPTEGKIQFTCNEISLLLSCEKKLFNNGIEVEKEKEDQ